MRCGLQELIASVAELGETRAIPELELRAGVVTGEVAVTLGATDQGMVAGDPVNTAARVQSAAGPGEVWVDAVTRSLTEGGVTYLDVGEHALKGKAETMQLYKVGTIIAAVGGSRHVDGLEAPLSGRERELRLVKELFHGTVESGRPRMVILDGEAGIGKTRLAWEFEKYVSGIQTDTYWHRGRCLSYGDGVAYWALAEAVRTRLGLVDDEPAAEVDLGALLARWVHDEAERGWIRPRLATLIGLEVGEFEREDLFSAWARFFERLGDDSQSVTLVIDDARCATTGSWPSSAPDRQRPHADVRAAPDAARAARGAPPPRGPPHRQGPSRAVERRLDERPGRRPRRGAPRVGPHRAGDPSRGHPAVRGRDGPRPDRPRHRAPRGRSLPGRSRCGARPSPRSTRPPPCTRWSRRGWMP